MNSLPLFFFELIRILNLIPLFFIIYQERVLKIKRQETAEVQILIFTSIVQLKQEHCCILWIRM